ncbi:MAG: universal stress protein [Balneolales bacterium]
MKNIKILVPTDLSELSNKALVPAEELVIIFGGTVTPVHTMLDLPNAESYSFPLSPEFAVDYEKVGKELKEKLDKVASQSVDKQYLKSAVVKKGLSTSSILETSADYDLIVMSSHGRSGFRRYLLGSVAEEVIRLSEVPVLIIKEEARLTPLKKIMVSTDFSDNSLAALPWVKEIAIKTDAEVDLVHVAGFDPYLLFGMNTTAYKEELIQKSEEKIKEIISDRLFEIKDKVTPKIITTPKSTHESLSDLIEKSNYDLVVMSTVGRTGLEYMLLDSTTANVVRNVSGPILVVRPEKKKL